MQQLRRHALSHSLFEPTDLSGAIHRLGFVQADPIRSPACAQDLILRHRVPGYRAGDLSRRYNELGIEEGFLYAYGFMPRDTWGSWRRASDPVTLPELEQNILAALRGRGPVHPNTLAQEFGQHRVKNAWGGQSRGVTHALERLHFHGLARVAGRQNGIRLYEVAPSLEVDRPSESERLRRLVLTEAKVMAPATDKTLASLAAKLRHYFFPGAEPHRKVIRELVKSGELEQSVVDGLTYLWPAGTATHEEIPRAVRFLAPFDPVVWDRSRFEHFWQWEYRFEAYTKKEKRLRGYYAMPLLWGEEVIGWANAGVTDGKLDVETGYINKMPKERAFKQELDAEIARLEEFLGLTEKSVPPKRARRTKEV